MLIIPTVAVYSNRKRRKLKAFDSSAISSLFISARCFREKSFIVGVTFADDSIGHIISGFDTEEEAQEEIDDILTAIESGKQVYRCVGLFDKANRDAYKKEDEHE